MKKSIISTLVPILAIALYLGGRYWYFKPELIQGEKAPNFTAQLMDGSEFSLSDLRGQYVLLDFWGSWCGPCRRQNPKWVAFYKEWAGKPLKEATGFTIVSVGIEKKEEAWRAAIAQDSLFWPYHILDLGDNLRFFNSTIAELYGVKQVPTTFLINPAGAIIANDPFPDEVEEILHRQLGD